ncbi:XRE family transcriptional regulator [Micromonospora lupini]|uniref:helix-turn-helix domain-containing protein n=1 Tax=Micromonospora lupini TaxID=285679 RepID=UPI00224D5D9F|nr:XRE family transcriptional regulator [Micromonospora lupini]MCX5064480.1 XRE family transcriptional regulator [Micromonospora lupini]
MAYPPNATRWRALPHTLPAPCTLLVTELRELKDRSRLSLDQLAAATAISRSSWERYLNGKQFPPRQAVRALCEAACEPDGRVLTCWDVADAAWSGRARSAPAGAGPASDVALADPPPRRRSGLVRRALLAASDLVASRPVASAVGVALACAAMVTPAAVVHASRASSVAGARPPICELRDCEGRNPRTTACEDPVTLASHIAADGTRLEIRLSPSCRAGWIRAWPTHAGFRVEISGPDTQPQTAVAATPATDQQVTTTAMIAAPDPSRLRACYHPAGDQPGQECFGVTN